MNNFSIIQVQPILGNSGGLYVLEKQERLPFEIKRVYYITNVEGDAVRGKHAHKELEQLLLCVGGSCDIFLDDGKNSTMIELNDPGKLLYIRPCLWREICNFSENATLVVFASEEYDEGDYIRDYDEFQKYMGEHQ